MKIKHKKRIRTPCLDAIEPPLDFGKRWNEKVIVTPTLRLPYRPLELAEKTLVVAPAGVDRDVEVEEDLRAEDRLQFQPRLGADPLDHLAPPADDDRLLRVPLDVDRGPHPDHPRTLRVGGIGLLFLEFLDGDGGAVRQLVGGVMQHFLADDLRGEEALGLR